MSRLQPTISGDLNCDGSDAAMKLLTTGAVEADDPDWLHGEEPQPSPEFNPNLTPDLNPDRASNPDPNPNQERSTGSRRSTYQGPRATRRRRR